MADRFWVGGAGTWNTSSTTNWSATSGGGSGASVPTVADSVFFDQAGTYTVTMTGALACLDITVSAGTVTFATGTSPSLTVSGSMSLVAGTVWSSTGDVTFSSTTTGRTVTTNGVTISASVTFSGVGGGWTLGSAFSVAGFLSIINGTFDTSSASSYSVNAGIFNASGSNTRTVNLNASTVTIPGNSNSALAIITSTNLTFNAGTSQIILSGTPSAGIFVQSGLTFYNVSFTATSSGSSCPITGSSTFNNFAVTATSAAGTKTVTFNAQQTINGTLSTTGTAGSRRVFFASATYGISQDLVINSAPSLTDADFRGLYVRGTAAPISGTRIGNRGECRGITFSTPKTVYWNRTGTRGWSEGWATTPTGAPSTDNFPLPQDTATFTNAGSVTGTISVDVPAVPNVDMSGRTSAMTLSVGTTTVYGNWTNGAGTTLTNPGILTFSGGTTQTITSAGKAFSGNIIVDTYGGIVQLADALSITSSDLTVTNGTFNTAGYAVGVRLLNSSNSNIRTINLGSSTVALGSGFSCATVTNLSFNSGTSQINIAANSPTFDSGGLTFYNVTFTSTNTSGATFFNSNIFNNLTFTARASAGVAPYDFAANQTINGTLTCAGASAVRRIFLRSSTIGTPRTITAAAISATDCDFRDINLAGTASGASPTRAGNCGGNTGITFPAPKTVYWNLAGSVGWTSTAWATGSGGTPAINNFPLAQDTAVFDNAGSVGTVVVDANLNVGTFDASARTSAMILTTNNFSIYGDWKFGAGVTHSSTGNTITFSGGTTQTITSNGVQFGCSVAINHPLANVQLADALSLESTRTLTLTAGTFDAVTYNVTTGAFIGPNSGSPTLNMGTGTWTLSGTGTIWNSTNGAPNVIASTSTIVLSNTSTSNRIFSGGQYYNKLTIGGTTGTSTLNINGANTFGEIASTKTVAHTITFPSNVTNTFGKWAVTGTVGNVVTVNSSGAGTAFTLSIAGPANSGIDYLSVRDCTVATTSPGEFYVGANSTNVSNNTRVVFTATPAPRTLYWVGGTGNWSSTTKWSTSSGGGSGAAIPTSLDAVNFDMMSNATAYTATIDVGTGGALARCASFTMTGPLVGNVTFAGSTALAFHGNVSFSATGITRTYAGAMFWAGNSSYTFTTNGLTLGSACTVIGAGSTWELGSAFNIGSTIFSITYGTFDTSVNNYSLASGALSSNNSNVRAVILNGSTLTLTSAATAVSLATTTNFTFNGGTSSIVLTGSGPAFNGGKITFNNLSFTSTLSNSIAITGANTFNTLSFAGRTGVGINAVTFSADQTITTLTLNAGTASAYRTFLASDTIGTTRTLTVGTLTAGAADIDFRDITIAGAAAPISGTRFGDAKGNSGITFPAAKTVYWALATSNNWGNTGAGSWSATNGGSAANTEFPLAQDTAYIPFAVPNNNTTITVNANYNIGTIDMNERNGSALVTLAISTNTPAIYGNWINGTGTTLTGTGTMTFAGRGSQTITSAGRTFAQPFTISTPGGSVTLQDSFVCSFASANAFTVNTGTFDASTYNFTLSAGSVNTNAAVTRTVAIGSGTWTLANSGTVWNASTSTNLTVTGTGTISLTSASAKTFTGGSVNYSSITLNQGGAGALTISGNNTFKDITNTYSATGATSITLGATTQTLINPWTATGEAGRVLTVSGTSAASPGTLIFSGGGQAANVDYLAINNVRAYDLVDEWYAGPNSTNGGSLGWYFIAAGGTVYAVTITETGTGTDAITARVTLLGTISETGTGTDTVSSSFLFVGSVNETSTITDSNFAAFQPKANITETATGSDVESAILAAIGLINETATGTDTDLARFIARATLAETATGTDTETARYVANPAIAETATGTDAETARYIARPVVNETATGADADNSILSAKSTIAETATGTDSGNALMTARSVVSETATGTDADSASLSANSNISETATAADAVSALTTLLASVSEAATATDLVSSIKGLFAYIVESATITDAVNAPGSTYNPSLSETATATDNISALALFAVQVAESASITDLATAFRVYLSAILEAASGSDAVSASFVARSAISETATGADIDAAAFTARSLVSETASGAEIVSSLRTLRPSIAETAAGTDAASTRNTTNPAIAEAATGTDAPTTTAEFQSQVTETSVAQDIVRGFMVAAVQVSESATGTDQISALRALAAAVVETVSGSDAVSAKAVFQGILQEIATLTDSVNAPGSTYSAPVVELATLQDAVRAAATFPTAVIEAATGTETNSAAFTPLVRIIETATVTDVASALAAFAARTAESASIADEVSPPGSIYNPVVLAVAQLVDQVSPAGSIYNAPILESAMLADFLIGGFLWNPIPDDQNPNWGPVNSTQTVTWTAVSDNQTPNWQNIGNAQGTGWTQVNTDDDPNWQPIPPP